MVCLSLSPRRGCWWQMGTGCAGELGMQVCYFSFRLYSETWQFIFSFQYFLALQSLFLCLSKHDDSQCAYHILFYFPVTQLSLKQCSILCYQPLISHMHTLSSVSSFHSLWGKDQFLCLHWYRALHWWILHVTTYHMHSRSLPRLPGGDNTRDLSAYTTVTVCIHISWKAPNSSSGHLITWLIHSAPLHSL